MPRLKRAALINGIGGIKSLNLIGTVNKEGIYNLAIFNSIMHIGSNPPMLGFILRPTTVKRHTYDNLKAINTFTVNHVNENIYKKAHQSAASYAEEESEFNKVGLTPEIIDNHLSPFVNESTIKMACKYTNEYFIKENGCRLIIGEILDIYTNKELVSEDGFVNLESAKSLGAIGLDAYVRVTILDRLEYARPDRKTKSIWHNGSQKT